jgi:hypothetical protein
MNKTIKYYLKSKIYLKNKFKKTLIFLSVLYLLGLIGLFYFGFERLNILYSNIFKYIINVKESDLQKCITILNNIIKDSISIYCIFDVLIMFLWSLLLFTLAYLLPILSEIIFISFNKVSQDNLKKVYAIQKEINIKTHKKISILVFIIVIGSLPIIYIYNEEVFDINIIINIEFYYLYVAMPILYIIINRYIYKQINQIKDNEIIFRDTLILYKRQLITFLYILMFSGLYFKVLIPGLKYLYDIENTLIISKTNLVYLYNTIKDIFEKYNNSVEFFKMYGDIDTLLQNISISRLFIEKAKNFDINIIENGFYKLCGIIIMLETISTIINISKYKMQKDRIIKKVFKDLKATFATFIILLIIELLFKKGWKDIISYNNIYILSIMFIFNQIIEK